MNERIKELIKQSTTEEHDGFLYFDKKKFAESIVKECADWIKNEKNEKGDYIPDSFYWASRLLKHFGVAE